MKKDPANISDHLHREKRSDYESRKDGTRQHPRKSHHNKKTDENKRKIHSGKHKTVKHKHKHRGNRRLHFGRYTIDPQKVRLRHHARPYYGSYTADSKDSILEYPDSHKSNENKHFERWKDKHWATLRSAFRRPHGESSFQQIKWGLRQHDEEKLADNWRESNAVRAWEKEVAAELQASRKAEAEAKAMLLANNRWPSVAKESAPLPHFAYHRVTSSPNLSRGGRSPPRQSAYVAVSLVPNATQPLST